MVQEENTNKTFQTLLKRSIILPFVSILILMGIILWQVKTVNQTNRWVRHTEEVMLNITKVRDHVLDMESALRSYLITGNKDFLEAYKKVSLVNDENLKNIEILISDNSMQAQRMTKFRFTSSQWEGYRDQAQLFRSRNFNSRSKFLNQMGEFSDSLRRQLSQLFFEEDRLMKARIDANETSERNIFIWIAGTMIFLKVLLAFASRRQLFVLSRIYDRVLDKQKVVEANLQKAVNVRDDFLSIASHELRTPLTSLYMQLQIIKNMLIKKKDGDTIDVETIRNKIDVSTNQAKQLGNLINNLLNISRIQSGGVTIEPETFDLSDLVQDVLLGFSEEAKLKGITLEFLDKEKINGSWDKVKIHQVVSNLVSNGLKYGDSKPIHISIKSIDGRVELKVADHGPGIASADQARIFNRFERATPHFEITGLGLGLFISKQIVEAHGGHISVESELKKGSTFIVDLPLHANAS